MKRKPASLFLTLFCTIGIITVTMAAIADANTSQAQRRGPIVDILGRAETSPPEAYALVSVVDPNTGRTIEGLTDTNFNVHISEEEVEATISLETQGIAVAMVIDRGGIARRGDPRIGEAGYLVQSLMDILNIDGTRENPTIVCDPDKGLIKIQGVSIGEDPLMQIYSPVLRWLEQYKDHCKPLTTLNIHLKYINTSSSRSLLHVFKRLRNIQLETIDAKVVVNWYYTKQDEEMLEKGEIFKEMSFLDFNFVGVEK